MFEKPILGTERKKKGGVFHIHIELFSKSGSHLCSPGTKRQNVGDT